jgi:competence protein ComEC
MKNSNKILGLVLILLALANFYLWGYIFRLNGNLHVVFFDVGQGEAIFIETPQGHQILIDGGSSKKILTKLGGEMPFWDRSLDLVILSHPEKDHLGGLNYVLRRYKVKNILWNGVEKDTKIFEYWKENLDKEKRKEKAREILAQRGQKIRAGNVQILVLYPFESLAGKKYQNSNDTSVIARLIFGKNSFLFTGDATKKTENQLIRENSLLNSFKLASQVLKIGHHGSKTSTSKEFLKEVSPEVAVISCGRNNPYGHPHQEVLRNLQDFGIKILTTSQKGDIKIVSDGNNLIY